MNNDPEYVYMIKNRDTGEFEGEYDRSYRTKYEFNTVKVARRSNIHGIFRDKSKYRIEKYKVTYELIDKDCDREEEDEPIT